MDVFKTDAELASMKMRVTGGPAMVYSFFNSVEGVGIFSKVLEAHGFTQFTESVWDGVSDISRVKRAPRYAFIKGGMNLTLKAKLMRVFNHPENRHGQLIRVVFVTQAAAEGISLYHLRQIHIMEPYWDNVLIEQVVGRGFRLRSHKYLADPREREIQVYHYFSERSSDARTDPNYWREAGVSQITDVIDNIIKRIADSKSEIVDQLKLIRGAAAIDCKINSEYNNLGVKCFDFRGRAAGGENAYSMEVETDVAEGQTVKKELHTQFKYKHFESKGKIYIIYPGKQVQISIRGPTKIVKVKADIVYLPPPGWKVDDDIDPDDFKKFGYLVDQRLLPLSESITEV
jgi:hypothetical protein